jgi:hypothetical protein
MPYWIIHVQSPAGEYYRTIVKAETLEQAAAVLEMPAGYECHHMDERETLPPALQKEFESCERRKRPVVKH